MYLDTRLSMPSISSETIEASTWYRLLDDITFDSSRTAIAVEPRLIHWTIPPGHLSDSNLEVIAQVFCSANPCKFLSVTRIANGNQTFQLSVSDSVISWYLPCEGYCWLIHVIPVRILPASRTYVVWLYVDPSNLAVEPCHALGGDCVSFWSSWWQAPWQESLEFLCSYPSTAFQHPL